MTKSNSLECKNKIPTSSKKDNNFIAKEIDSEENKGHLSVFKESCKNELVKSKNTLICDDLVGQSKSDVSSDQLKSDKKVELSNEIMMDQSKCDEKVVGQSKYDEKIVDQSKSYERVAGQSKYDERVVNQSQSEEKIVDQSKSDEKMADQSQFDERVVNQSKCDASRYTLTCPVCFNSKFDSELNLNQHIDICLNKEFIEDALKSRQEL